MVEQAGERQAQLLELWRGRQTLLEHTTTLFQFRALAEEVRVCVCFIIVYSISLLYCDVFDHVCVQILHWHATECATFMADESFGDSIDDVERLITRHQEFVEGQMPVSQLKLQQVEQKETKPFL